MIVIHFLVGFVVFGGGIAGVCGVGFGALLMAKALTMYQRGKFLNWQTCFDETWYDHFHEESIFVCLFILLMTGVLTLLILGVVVIASVSIGSSLIG